VITLPPVKTIRRICASFLAVSLLLLALAGCSSEEGGSTLSSGSVDFNWDIRPILSDKCFACHGPDREGLKAGLRLDVRELAIAELPETPGSYAIVPGNPGDSELVRRITASDVDLRMPPESSHKVLSETEKDLLQQWIREGARYKEHWAYLPPALTPVPETSFDGRVENVIDAYVFSRLEQEGLAPSTEAEKEALINRVALTLTGLPPSLEAVDAFLADDSPVAYENLVDGLLASPRYGEHMAGYWMDLARWSETDGFLDDHHDRVLWPWRDWVIDAFNNNMPYDEFATRQLAGDLLPDPGRDDLLATTFVRLGKRTTENGAIAEEYSAEYRAERTDNLVGTTFLGLTLGCARCHDHRYDPVSQKDYYAISAFFNNSDEPGVYAPGFSGIQGGPTLPWPDENAATRISQAEAEVSRLEQRYLETRASVSEQAAISADRILEEGALASYLETSINRDLAAYYSFDAAIKADLEDLPEPMARRVPPPTINGLMAGPYAIPVVVDLENETELQRRSRELRELEGRVPRNYNRDQLYLSAAENAGVPDAVLQEPLLGAGAKGQAMFFDETNKGFLGRDVGWYDRTDPFSIDFRFFIADDYDEASILNHLSEQNSGSTGYQLSLRDGRLWVSLAHSPPANMIALLSDEALPVGEWVHLTLTYDGSSSASGVLLYVDGLPLAMTVDHDSLTRSMLPWGTGDVFDPFVGLAFGTRFRVKAPVGSGMDEMRIYDRPLNALEVAYLHDPELPSRFPEADVAEDLSGLVIDLDEQVAVARDNLIAARTVQNELVTAVPQVLVMGTAPGHEATYVLDRGVYSEPADEVLPRGLDVVLPWNEDLPQNRLGLAQWLFDPDNPLTARVFVNRIWQMHFGHGLVETSEDFGSQGSIPSHPELLDWLTIEFVDSGWNIKYLHRLIVTSSTYRQDSDLNAVLQERDPGNQLYARGPRWRMTAEMIRDQVLFLSGTLSEEVGGPSATPYQPDDIWNPLNSFYGYPEADAIPEEEHHRRTLYTFVKRNAPHPALGIFDFRNRTESIARRRSSNTPLQALLLMNDPQYLEAYRLLAENVLTSTDEDIAGLTLLSRLVTRATPSLEQLGILERYYHEQVAYFAENSERAAEAVAVGVTAVDPALDIIELAAMANVAALLMNAPDTYVVK
jgi:hypothetical protein